MNLLEMMQREVVSKGLTDKLEIAYYLYMRTGQIFEYNKSFPFMNASEKKKFINPNVDITNIKNKYIVCFKWAPIFKELLIAFGISAEVLANDFHANVSFSINGENFIADLMANFEDLFRIKVGLPPINFGRFCHENNKILPYKEVCKSSNECFLMNVKTTLFEKYNAMKTKWVPNRAKQEYTYLVFKTIEKIINEKGENLEFLVGEKYISYLLREFTQLESFSTKTYFYNETYECFIAIYSLFRGNNEPVYFSYEKMDNGSYELHEVPLIYVQSLIGAYIARHAERLLLPQVETIYHRALLKTNSASVK